MNRRTIAIAAPLLALVVALAIRQTQRARQSVPSPSAAEPKAEAQQVAVGETPNAPDADAASRQAIEPALSPGAVKTAATSPQLRPIAEAIETSYASTIAAFALHGEEADYETHDAQAQRDADRLQQVFSSMHADLSPELASSCEAVIDRIAAAQLQLMAFAINRKNRGLPDSAQAEAELADRRAFEDDTAPLFERVKAALSTAGPDISSR